MAVCVVYGGIRVCVVYGGIRVCVVYGGIRLYRCGKIRIERVK